ncbi:MAG: hypothetical protein IPJ30_10455 [Acidobacteria bacterium]|nr:hypothetical protein [Acidobacteriota bacterium]
MNREELALSFITTSLGAYFGGTIKKGVKVIFDPADRDRRAIDSQAIPPMFRQTDLRSTGRSSLARVSY